MNISKHQFVSLCSVLIIILSGCYKDRTKNIESFQKPHETEVTVEEYILQPADEITISATRVPELNEQVQTIRPDGKISFETIGEIPVAGKTPSQVAQILAESISNIYTLQDKNPIDVRVSNFQSKLYYIIGQVRSPGAKVFSGRESTLSAIAKAVPTFQAWEEKIQLIRPSTGPNARAKICQLNFNKMIKDGDMTFNVLLEEGDLIYVPPTILAAIGLTVGELVNPILGGASLAQGLTDGTTP